MPTQKEDKVMYYAQQCDSLRDQLYDCQEMITTLRHQKAQLEKRVEFLDAEKRRIAVLAGLEPDDPKPQPYVPLAGVKSQKLKANRARCRRCDDTVESRAVHDYVECYCGAVAVDGGLEYLHRTGEPDDIEELSEYEK